MFLVVSSCFFSLTQWNVFSLEVKPIMDVAPLMDMDIDSDDDGECDPSINADTITMEHAFQVCSSALQRDGRISESIDRKTLLFLQHRKMVDLLEGGQVVLSREAIKHGTEVCEPVLERTLRGEPTTLELQYDLRVRGWKFSTNLQEGSVQDKVALEGNPSTYYVLLTHFDTNLLEYEEEELFHHRQSEPYYKTVEVALTSIGDDLVEIPTYKKATFYDDLQRFILGESSDDPRQQIQQSKRRTYNIGMVQEFPWRNVTPLTITMCFFHLPNIRNMFVLIFESILAVLAGSGDVFNNKCDKTHLVHVWRLWK